MSPSSDSPCPCGSASTLAACCLPYIEGRALPATAEGLMRSRYAAHALARVPYLVATCHPDLQRLQDAAAIASWCREAQFLRLDVLETKAGGPADSEGVVRFVAWTRRKGKLEAIHERSMFKRHAGQWTYHSGRHQAVPWPGANDPCPCGSGKKFKKCCG